MTTKKVKPEPKRRAPRKEPPLSQHEVLFCHLVMKGDGSSKANQTERIEKAGAKVGYTALQARQVYHRKPVQKYLEAYRDRLMIEMAKEEVRILKRKGYCREDVLDILHDLALIPAEKTRGSISGQVAAAAEMGKILGLVVVAKNPDDLFKGRSEEEMLHYAEHGSFSKPRVN